VDWWALGVTVFLMVVGDFPFNGDDEDDVYQAVMENTPEYPGWMSDASTAFIKKVGSVFQAPRPIGYDPSCSL